MTLTAAVRCSAWFGGLLIAIGRDDLSAVGEELCPHRGYRDQRLRVVRTVMLEEASVVGLFPNRQSRAGRAPSLNHLAIRPCFGTDPFQQIEDQSLNRIRHGCTSWGCPQVGRGARQTASCRRTSELSIGRRPSELRTPRNRSGGGRLLRRLDWAAPAPII